MNSLVMALAITCGFLLVTCIYLATKGKYYKGIYNESVDEAADYYDKLVREKKAHSLLKNSLKKTK